MFEFTELDGMDRHQLKGKQLEAKRYWKTTFHLKAAFLAWGKNTDALIEQCRLEGSDTKFIKGAHDLAIRGEITVKRLTNHLLKIDDYLKQIDARLCDGSKWYSAGEIEELYNQSVEVSNE